MTPPFLSSFFSAKFSLPAEDGNRTRFRYLFTMIILTLLILMPMASFDFGITFDEWMDSNNGMLALRYLISGGQDHEFLKFWHGIYYGQFFYCVTGFVYGFLFDTVEGFAKNGLHQNAHLLRFYTTSHFINAIFGFIAILFTGLLAKKAGSWRTACIAVAFMAFSPRFFGHAMNNPKDIPFAATYIASVYYLACFLKEFPTPKIRTSACLSIATALAIGTRIGGFVIFFYLWTLTSTIWLWCWLIKKDRIPVFKMATHLLSITVSAYFCGLIFWPYGQLDPLHNPITAFQEMSHFTHWDHPVLFEGQLIQASKLPWYYLPQWIIITVPLFIIAGWSFFVLLFHKLPRIYKARTLMTTLVCGLFPPIYSIINGSVIYDEWRHFIFIYPLLVIMAVLPWDYLFQIAQNKGCLLLLGVVFTLHLAEPLTWMIRNHPNEYVYFNPISGGIQGAFGQFETDYWGNSLRQAAEWLGQNHKEKYPNRTCVIRSDGNPMSTYAFLNNKLGNHFRLMGYPENFVQNDPYFFLAYPPYLQGPPLWDYAIVLSRGWKGEILRENNWPPPHTIHEVKANGITLCAVVKNPASSLN